MDDDSVRIPRFLILISERINLVKASCRVVFCVVLLIKRPFYIFHDVLVSYSMRLLLLTMYEDKRLHAR
jgi:xylose isomerase